MKQINKQKIKMYNNNNITKKMNAYKPTNEHKQEKAKKMIYYMVFFDEYQYSKEKKAYVFTLIQFDIDKNQQIMN